MNNSARPLIGAGFLAVVAAVVAGVAVMDWVELESTALALAAVGGSALAAAILGAWAARAP